MRVLLTAWVMLLCGAAVHAEPPPVVVPAPGAADAAWHLGRAVDLWDAGDLRGAAVHLEAIDIGRGSAFTEADRAAFLLAAARVELGDREGLARVVAAAGDPRGSAWRRWVAYLGLLDGVTDVAVDGIADSELVAAARRLEAGDPRAAADLLTDDDDPLSRHLLAVATAALGADETGHLRELARQEPSSALEAELVAAAVLELAARELAAGRDPRPVLERMPATSSRSPRGNHLLALSALASGDTVVCKRLLTELAAAHPDYAERRSVLLERGALAAAAADWPAALAAYEAAEQDLADSWRRLTGLTTAAGAAAAWTTWDQAGDRRDEIRLTPERTHRVLAEQAARARNLKQDDAPRFPADPFATGPSPASPRHDGPTATEWIELRALRAQRADAELALARHAWHLEQSAADRERRAAYLDRGRGLAVTSADTLAAAVARLELLLARLDLALADLDATRDQALARYGRRGRAMAEELRRNLLYLAAVEHFHVDVPTRRQAPPAGVPAPADLLILETGLSRAMERFLADFAARSVELVNRSHDTVWRPRLLGDAPALHAALSAARDRARQDVALLDSTAAAHATDPAWRAAYARYDSLIVRRDALAAAEDDLKLVIAAAVAARGQARLDAEREGIALHAADAAYWLAVAAASDGEPDPATDGPPRTAAMARHQAFLTDHPSSAARGEMRFRLADLHLLQAREGFRGQMAVFLADDPTADDLQNRALAPFVETAPALALYAAILAEDPDYAHREAVLFSLGMILADDGRPAAREHLRELVSEHPGSPYAQEAWLRLGDLSREQGDLAGCRASYARAATGDDPDLKGIALYKLGWARFAEDLFAEAADAFGALLDHGAATGLVDSEAQDLDDEAQQYLVRSLLRAGGAPAFDDHFARHGDRSYAEPVLFAMGRLSRRFALHDEAVACDELWLARYGNDPRAVDVASRLVDTHRRADRSDAARAALQAQAPRFLAGSPWHAANDEDALRERGEDFSREAYRTLATHHHRLARDGGDQADWQAARDHYETWLDHWPEHPAGARLHYQAGEAAARLGSHAGAIDHFARAAAADTGSFLVDAAWQVVAVTDAWYEAADRPDSLATRLLAAGEAFSAAHPGDQRHADLAWRRGNVAAAHGWHERAAGIFAAFGVDHGADPRSVDAGRLAGDAWYRLAAYQRAGDAYADARARARTAGRDSLATVLAAAIPLCRFQHAEQVAADSTRGPVDAAPLFLAFADRWPGQEHTDLALYRAGLGFGGERAVSAWERLLADHPDSDYGRDAALEIARIHAAADRPLEAARAYRRFSHVYRDDPEAADALLLALDLADGAGDAAAVRRLEDDFVKRFPGETEQVMAIRHARASGAVADLGAGTATLAGLLRPGSDLEAYLAAAAAHPQLADPRLLARVDYERAEEAFATYEALTLTQPLPPSLEVKKVQLEQVVALYNACAAHGVKEYAHAAAHRIGAAIVHFGDALAASERPADLAGDDLVAYEEVLEEQGWDFHARGEAAWTELLKQTRDDADDPGDWIVRTQEVLWPRVAMQFLHRPEVEYPLVAAVAPAEAR